VLARAGLLAVAIARALPDAVVDQVVVGGEMADPLVEAGAVDDADRGGDGVQGEPVELAPQVESAGSLGGDGLPRSNFRLVYSRPGKRVHLAAALGVSAKDLSTERAT
jgi:hypothetical protein